MQIHGTCYLQRLQVIYKELFSPQPRKIFKIWRANQWAGFYMLETSVMNVIKGKPQSKGVFRTRPSKYLLFKLNHRITRKNVWDMFKVINKDTRIFNSHLFLVFILWTLNIYLFSWCQKFMMKPFEKVSNRFYLLHIFVKKLHQRSLSGF